MAVKFPGALPDFYELGVTEMEGLSEVTIGNSGIYVEFYGD